MNGSSSVGGAIARAFLFPGNLAGTAIVIGMLAAVVLT